MIPVLYEQEETSFITNGIGRLKDAIECNVTEELNDYYTLQMTYSADGAFAGEIIPGRIVLATPNSHDRPQPFRIYEVDRTLNGLISVRANHISYDLSGIPARNITGITTASGAVAALSSRSIISSGFTFSTDLSVSANWEKRGAFSVRSAMGGDGSILETFGGEWYFDRYECKLLANRGDDSGVSVRYGRNLTGLEDVLDDTDAYTGVFTYYYSNGTYVSATSIVYLDNTAVPQKILIIDHTSDFQSTPTKEDLDTLANADLALIIGGTQSITVSFIPTIEPLKLGDFVTVIFERYDIYVKLEVVQTDFNVLLERYNTIELGAIRRTLADIIASR